MVARRTRHVPADQQHVDGRGGWVGGGRGGLLTNNNIFVKLLAPYAGGNEPTLPNCKFM